MKRLAAFLLVVVCFVACSACDMFTPAITKHFGFTPSHFTIVEEKDTHGGPHGDGLYYLILDCSGHAEEARTIVGDWRSLPLSENLNQVMYSSGYGFAEKARWPDMEDIENGVYKFVDRYSSERVKDREDDSNLLNRDSFNFSIAVYDLDSDRLYYFEMDT